ncbi:MAG TPA: hypothetical protein VG757_13270, partial [Devosia sp.]|nr:hypothetical protein [Devosia sp.]
GERGVGKTSLAKIVPLLVPKGPRQVRYIRVQAFPNDTFSTVAREVFKRIRFPADIGEGEKMYSADDGYSGEVTPADFVREMSLFSKADIPVVVIDEFNEIRDPSARTAMANSIKALSDDGSNVTLVIVGVADNVADLIKEHESIQRCTEEIPMPRMDKQELVDVLDVRLRQLEYGIDGDAKWKIVNLAKGLPAYVHHLGRHSCLKALEQGRLHVNEQDVDAAIVALIQATEQSFRDAYHAATRSNQPGTLLKQALTACALARPDESGYFTPSSVKEPLSAILGKPIEIANFQTHLKAFISPERGEILQRKGEPRAYRFRFTQPAMQPYVLMRGITEGLLDSEATRVLSYPEEPDLFANEP